MRGHSLPILGLGVFFALGGIALFAVTLRKATSPSTAPLKKSELRAQQAQQTETNKMRVAAAVMVAVGAALMFLS